jgi:triosephosphate isomerase
MTKLRHLVAGNWKMNGSRSMAAQLIGELKAGGGAVSADLLVCPPFPYLIHASEFLMGSNIALGAQDCAPKESGAHTGDVAAVMLKDCGCSHVILGHSERRTDHGESSAEVSAKAKAAQAAGLIAIVCVGETDSQRDAGETLKVVESQIVNSIPAGSTTANLVVAYEPVWAIGTGHAATTEQAVAVHRAIRARIAAGWSEDAAEHMRILYGGSVTPQNAASLLSESDIDGALVGGACLKTESFATIVLAAKNGPKP